MLKGCVISFVAMLMFFTTTVGSQPDPMQELRKELRRGAAQALFAKSEVDIAPHWGNSTDRMAIAPVSQHWVDILRSKKQAILGVLYTTVDLKGVGIGKGFYVVQAKGEPTKADWFLIRPDGSTAAGPIRAISRSLKISVTVPRAILIRMSPERGCFEDNGYEQCGDFD